MIRRYDRYKDIPLGLIIKKDLRKRNMSQKSLAQLIGMSYSSLNKALNGHSNFSVEQATAIDSFFGYEEAFIFRLQMVASTKITKIKENSIICKDKIPYIRPCVFWDTDMQSLDWIRHRNFIEQRVVTYGNQEEKTAIANFYASLK